MRLRVRVSLSALAQFKVLLAQGADKFGASLADDKRKIVVGVIESYLAENPHRGLQDHQRELRYYPVSKTPFIVVYEYDSTELRVLFIMHKRSDRRYLDVKDVEW
jgi:plasmid stabilization system protein ParE